MVEARDRNFVPPLVECLHSPLAADRAAQLTQPLREQLLCRALGDAEGERVSGRQVVQLDADQGEAAIDDDDAAHHLPSLNEPVSEVELRQQLDCRGMHQGGVRGQRRTGSRIEQDV